MLRRKSALYRCIILTAFSVSLAVALPTAFRASPQGHAGVDEPRHVIAREPLPISIEVDGRFQDLVEVPKGLFDGGWTTNLTQSEIGGGTEPGRKRGKGLYPQGSLTDFDLARYLTAVTGAVRTHVPRDETGIATLDFEGGLYPWAEKSRDKYKDKLTDGQFEELSKRFFVRSLRVAKATRPNAKWCYWGYPRTWQSKELIERMADIYAECDALAPSLHIRRSGNTKAIQRDVANMGTRIALIKDIHPHPEELVVAAYLWDKNAATDHQRPRSRATLKDMLTTARAAEAWADQLVIWVGAGTEAEAKQLTESLAPGGHIFTFIETYRKDREPDGQE